MPTFDVLISGGTLVDGSGAAARTADLAIDGGQIAATGDLSGAHAATVVDATGLVVAPGFIDVHVHSELARLGGQDQFAGVLAGVTTELMGPDGFGWAPLAPERLQEVREYLQVFYGDPPVDWDWTDVSGYLSQFEGRIPNNLAPQAPHLAIKVGAMGWDAGAPDAEQLAAMKRALREWLDAGAVGMAAGLEYQPGALSHVSELVELCRLVAGEGGVYAPHQRGYGEHVSAGCGETFDIARQSGVAVHISHLAVDETVERILGAADVDVTFDMYPYAASCTHLLMMLPDWAQAGGYAASMQHLQSGAARLRDETAGRLGQRGQVILSSVEGGDHLEGRSLAELSLEGDHEHGEPVDAMLALLREHAGRALAVYHWPPELDGDGIIRRTVAHPLFIGATDGIYMGSRPHRRGFGTFARLAGDLVRAGAVSLEQAVHSVTGRPARRFGLRDRGLLETGRSADVTIFDPVRFADVSTWEDGRSAPSGLAHVFVNGRQVVADGSVTGRLPGRVISRS